MAANWREVNSAEPPLLAETGSTSLHSTSFLAPDFCSRVKNRWAVVFLKPMLKIFTGLRFRSKWRAALRFDALRAQKLYALPVFRMLLQ
jgi:hypothetical protein